MTVLSVNVNKIAVLRNSRGGAEPRVTDAAEAALKAEGREVIVVSSGSIALGRGRLPALGARLTIDGKEAKGQPFTPICGPIPHR